MSLQLSFSKLEKKFLPQFREKINTSEDIVDVQKYFSHTVTSFLQSALEKEQITINEDAIELTNTPPYYSIKNIDSTLTSIWDKSDLKNILRRFAEIAHKRYVRLLKHPSKTNKKIRRP